jgi:hypothetical protein
MNWAVAGHPIFQVPRFFQRIFSKKYFLRRFSLSSITIEFQKLLSGSCDSLVLLAKLIVCSIQRILINLSTAESNVPERFAKLYRVHIPIPGLLFGSLQRTAIWLNETCKQHF